MYFDKVFNKHIQAVYYPDTNHTDFEVLEVITLTKEVADIFRENLKNEQ